MARGRELSDGSILFPNNGQTPDVPSGYKRDITNPFVMVPLPVECQYRTGKYVCRDCKAQEFVQWCNKFDIQVNPKICKECVVPDKVPS